MRRPELKIRRARGFLLIVAVFVLVVVAIALVALGNMTSADIRASSGHAQSEQGYFVALSGLERATRILLEPTLSSRVPCASLSGDASVTNIAVGPGKFTVTAPGGAAVYPSPPASLNGNLTGTAMVIPASSVAGYSASGRIMIDRELIDYTGTSNSAAICGAAPCFVGAHRGRAGTAANAHASGTRVGQYQCNVQSAGAVPDPANPQAERLLAQGTQLHEAWAVGLQGPVAASRPWILRFQETAWTQVNTAAINVNAQLNAISMLSYTDGFAVGNPGGVANRPFVVRWNGAAWAPVNTGLAINRSLNGVSCVAANDCWAVGVAGAVAAQRPWIIRWDGAAWSNNNTGVSGTNVDLNKVYCRATDDCWAVGNVSGGEYIIHWTGAAWARVGPIAAIPDTILNAVYCPAANDCWAVGNSQGGNEVIVRWQGGPNWVRMGPYAAVPNVSLLAVHCVDRLDCWAVGVASGGNVNINHWNGATWSPAPVLVPAVSRQLNSIACVNANDCWAVGNSDGLGELVLKWDGIAWTRVGPSGALDDRNLLAVHVIGAARRAPSARREIHP